MNSTNMVKLLELQMFWKFMKESIVEKNLKNVKYVGKPSTYVQVDERIHTGQKPYEWQEYGKFSFSLSFRQSTHQTEII